MKYSLIIVVLIAISGGAYWWFTNDMETEVVETIAIVEEEQSVEEITIDPTIQEYRNDTWGIAFEYPTDWEAYENTFRAGSSIFNVVLQPNSENALPRPVLVNIAPRDWGQTLMDRAPNNEGYKETEIASRKGVSYQSQDMGLPTTVYLVPVEGVYWIMIIVKDGYEETLNQVLDSLQITPVSIPE